VSRSWKNLPQLSLHSPVGDLTISEEDGAIVSVDWDWGRDQTETSLLSRAKTALLHFFYDRSRFPDDLPLAPSGTVYQKKVWRALCEIPVGQTRTYIDIARVAGGCPRSVGMANRSNKIPIFIPCHRVVAVGGIGGYSGGDGLATKRRLLALERGALI
jgi:methylated-DNA-[protein]-cysteine S-methyltransferase